MFWDKVSSLYDPFEIALNGKVYRGTGEAVAKEIAYGDEVLECACGTGAISAYIAHKCKSLIATDISSGMLKRTAKKTRYMSNVRLGKADMSRLRFRDERFDKVVAGNAIHLVDDPQAALKELVRVCKKGGKIIVPTYVNLDKDGKNGELIKLLDKMGADFKRQFDFDSYQKFFADSGYENVKFKLIEGRIPCAIAVITK